VHMSNTCGAGQLCTAHDRNVCQACCCRCCCKYAATKTCSLSQHAAAAAILRVPLARCAAQTPSPRAQAPLQMVLVRLMLLLVGDTACCQAWSSICLLLLLLPPAASHLWPCPSVPRAFQPQEQSPPASAWCCCRTWVCCCYIVHAHTCVRAPACRVRSSPRTTNPPPSPSRADCAAAAAFRSAAAATAAADVAAAAAANIVHPSHLCRCPSCHVRSSPTITAPTL
jgi:hypothetical protein